MYSALIFKSWSFWPTQVFLVFLVGQVFNILLPRKAISMANTRDVFKRDKVQVSDFPVNFMSHVGVIYSLGADVSVELYGVAPYHRSEHLTIAKLEVAGCRVWHHHLPETLLSVSDVPHSHRPIHSRRRHICPRPATTNFIQTVGSHLDCRPLNPACTTCIHHASHSHIEDCPRNAANQTLAWLLNVNILLYCSSCVSCGNHVVYVGCRGLYFQVHFVESNLYARHAKCEVDRLQLKCTEITPLHKKRNVEEKAASSVHQEICTPQFSTTPRLQSSVLSTFKTKSRPSGTMIFQGDTCKGWYILEGQRACKMTMKTIHFVWLCLTIGLLVTVSSRPYRRFLRQRRQENPALTILIGTKRCEREGGFKFELPFEIEISTMGHMVMVSNLNCMISSKIKKKYSRWFFSW